MICAKCGKEHSVGVNNMCMRCYNVVNPRALEHINFEETETMSLQNNKILELEQRIADIERKNNFGRKNSIEVLRKEIDRLKHGIRDIKFTCSQDGSLDTFGFIRNMCNKLLEK